MSHITTIFDQVYKQGKLFGVDKKMEVNPFRAKGKRVNSVAICGGAFGDEGKGRVTDELTASLVKGGRGVVHYRDNGGANAGHTIEIGKTRIALHQLSSGVMQKGCTVISGKGMVIHPEDLVEEMEMVKKAMEGELPARLLIDEMACLSLDTHRAFENVLKTRQTGSLGATGRGIAPAYADIVYRHPVRMRDLMRPGWKKILSEHYRLYSDLVCGFGFKLEVMEVARLSNKPVKVGGLATFLRRMEEARRELKPFTGSVYEELKTNWEGKTGFVFEKAQALGLDARYGVYPDVTASDCSFEGIAGSTEGVVNPDEIAVRAAVIKATYTSSVGTRMMPSEMEEGLASRIREDAHEYGATTKRPRDIHYIDIPLLRFLRQVGKYEYLCPTHLDISYRQVPIKVCVAYVKAGKEVAYRPDQEYLRGVEPKFMELPSWDGEEVLKAKTPKDLPKETLAYLAFMSQALGVEMLMATTGPKRDQTVRWY